MGCSVRRFLEWKNLFIVILLPLVLLPLPLLGQTPVSSHFYYLTVVTLWSAFLTQTACELSRRFRTPRGTLIWFTLISIQNYGMSFLPFNNLSVEKNITPKLRNVHQLTYNFKNWAVVSGKVRVFYECDYLKRDCAYTCLKPNREQCKLGLT